MAIHPVDSAISNLESRFPNADPLYCQKIAKTIRVSLGIPTLPKDLALLKNASWKKKVQREERYTSEETYFEQKGFYCSLQQVKKLYTDSLFPNLSQLIERNLTWIHQSLLKEEIHFLYSSKSVSQWIEQRLLRSKEEIDALRVSCEYLKSDASSENEKSELSWIANLIPLYEGIREAIQPVFFIEKKEEIKTLVQPLFPNIALESDKEFGEFFIKLDHLFAICHRVKDHENFSHPTKKKIAEVFDKFFSKITSPFIQQIYKEQAAVSILAAFLNMRKDDLDVERRKKELNALFNIRKLGREVDLFSDPERGVDVVFSSVATFAEGFKNRYKDLQNGGDLTDEDKTRMNALFYSLGIADILTLDLDREKEKTFRAFLKQIEPFKKAYRNGMDGQIRTISEKITHLDSIYVKLKNLLGSYLENRDKRYEKLSQNQLVSLRDFFERIKNIDSQESIPDSVLEDDEVKVFVESFYEEIQAFQRSWADKIYSDHKLKTKNFLDKRPNKEELEKFYSENSHLDLHVLKSIREGFDFYLQMKNLKNAPENCFWVPYHYFGEDAVNRAIFDSQLLYDKENTRHEEPKKSMASYIGIPLDMRNQLPMKFGLSYLHEVMINPEGDITKIKQPVKLEVGDSFSYQKSAEGKWPLVEVAPYRVQRYGSLQIRGIWDVPKEPPPNSGELQMPIKVEFIPQSIGSIVAKRVLQDPYITPPSTFFQRTATKLFSLSSHSIDHKDVLRPQVDDEAISRDADEAVLNDLQIVFPPLTKDYSPLLQEREKEAFMKQDALENSVAEAASWMMKWVNNNSSFAKSMIFGWNGFAKDPSERAQIRDITNKDIEIIEYSSQKNKVSYCFEHFAMSRLVKRGEVFQSEVEKILTEQSTLADKLSNDPSFQYSNDVQSQFEQAKERIKKLNALNEIQEANEKMLKKISSILHPEQEQK